MDAIFLSASIPKPGREYFGKADPLLIHLAVRSFLALVLGRRHIVWGGHPSITPMVVAACDGMDVDYAHAVTLYQSRRYTKNFPKENSRFQNLILIDEEADDQSSLKALRTTMFGRDDIKAAVFIGGMNGILDEYSLLRQSKPGIVMVPVPKPGGAAFDLALQNGYDPNTDPAPTDFTQLFIDSLGISTAEPRQQVPQQGPTP